MSDTEATTAVSAQAELAETQRRQTQRVRSMLAFMLVLASVMFGLGLLHA